MNVTPMDLAKEALAEKNARIVELEAENQYLRERIERLAKAYRDLIDQAKARKQAGGAA